MSKDLTIHRAPGIPSFLPYQQVAPGTAVAPKDKPLPKAFTPLTIRGVTFQNRVWASPMCQFSYEDGFINDWTLTALGSYALRGASLSLIEASAVSPEGRISPWDAGIWKDEHIAGVKKVADFVHGQNQKLGIQIAHAGRMGSTAAPWLGGGVVPVDQGGYKTVAPSEGAFYHKRYSEPRALTTKEVRELVLKFRDAAVRAAKAGVDVVEIHGAHGYLINEFLSPVSNKRTDAYGGSPENRMRFLKEIVEEIKAAIPDKILLFLRVSASDRLEYKNEGLTPKDYVEIMKVLKPLGVDFLDVSSGGVSPLGKIEYTDAFQAKYAYPIKDALPELAVGAVGAIHTPEVITEVLERGLDAVFVGRPFAMNPSFLLELAEKYGLDVRWPHQIAYTRRRQIKL